MGYNYHRSKVDANHAQIVKAARQMGAVVIDCSPLKNAFDALIAFRGRLYCVEIKDGSKTPSQQKLTTGEIECKKSLNSVGVDYHVVTSVDELVELLR